MSTGTELRKSPAVHTGCLPGDGLTSAAFLLLAVFALACLPRLTAASQKQTEILAAVDKAEQDRETRLLGYSVQESYALFRRADRDPSAAMEVSTTYLKDKGKAYRIVSESGSQTSKYVLHKILQGEEKLSHGKDRNDLLITSRNYDMSLTDSAVHPCNQRSCLVLQLKARRPSPYLLDGKVWVDATTYHVVRVEGIASASSALTGRPTVVRDYTDIDGVPVAVHARSVSSQVLLGETVLDIKYQNYRLNVSKASALSTTPTHQLAESLY